MNPSGAFKGWIIVKVFGGDFVGLNVGRHMKGLSHVCPIQIENFSKGVSTLPLKVFRAEKIPICKCLIENLAQLLLWEIYQVACVSKWRDCLVHHIRALLRRLGQHISAIEPLPKHLALHPIVLLKFPARVKVEASENLKLQGVILVLGDTI